MGFNIPNGFNDSDLHILVRQLLMFLNEYNDVIGLYFIPAESIYGEYTKYMEVLGMHENVDICKDLQATKLLFDSILLTLGSTSAQGGDTDKQLMDISQDISGKLPHNFNIELAMQKQSCLKVTSLKSSPILTLQKAIKGLLVMNQELESFVISLLIGKVSEVWNKPTSFWVSGFYFTQAFLTGVKQNFAREYTISIDLLTFDFEVIAKDYIDEHPTDGAYIYGLFVDGAICDREKSSLFVNGIEGLISWDSLVYIKYNEYENEKIINFENDSFKVKTGHKYFESKNVIEIFCQEYSLSMLFSNHEDYSKMKEWLQSKSSIKDETSPKTSQNSEIKTLIAESFTTNLLENSCIGISSRKFLSNQIRKYIESYNELIFYGPYAILFQSSGFGKSRACFGLVDEGFYVVYCCLLDLKSNGYPRRSTLADFLLKKDNVETNFKCYFKTFIDILNEKKETYSCTEFFDSYGNPDGLGEKISIHQNIEDIKQVSIPVYEKKTPLVFVFDEASSLFPDNYFILRSLTSNLKGSVFVLFLDTFSQLADFMPVTYQDPSKRISEKKLKVFEPIYLLPNWDVFIDRNYEKIKNIKDSILFENACMFGRPLWGSWIYTKNNSHKNLYESISNYDLFNLACDKLMSGNRLAETLNDNDCLAVLSSRLGILKPKQITKSQQLVATNMAVCTYLDVKNNLFEIDYPSEPILAAASAIIMEQNFPFILNTMIKLTESSLISTGDKGEIIAKLILLRAIDKAYLSSGTSQSSIKYINSVKVGIFTQTLFGKCNDNCGSETNDWQCTSSNEFCSIKIISSQILNPKILLNAFINFNHFTKPQALMKHISLVDSLKRCAAIHCFTNQNVFDLIIPVSINENNFKSVSAIMVQVKLYENPPSIDFVSACLGLSSNLFYDLNKNNPYLMLYMQLGSNKNQSFVKNLKKGLTLRGTEHKKQAIIYSEGISKSVFPILNSEIEALLKSFSVADRKLFKLSDDLEMDKWKAYQITRYSLRKKSNCHPHFANFWSSNLEETFIVALGECGLDQSRNYEVELNQQIKVFQRQLKIASQTHMPIVIHCRQTEEKCLEMLKEHLNPNYRIHLHCFTGNSEIAMKYLDSEKHYLKK
ncbi:dynein heavy chain axonemal [Brachionus plicatilis]|uniref:Dynein heavy chain axonemal n=1 Tax=Brachionus plicatilis TaxID=10195 RepID=A0A3M7R0J1_BRAPC|nr:dynein heavy chain axonemal [Brachionus plicatilis]